jgi:hypothetical protein
MPATYDVTTPTGQVRLLANDVDTTAAVFTDDEIAAFLVLGGGVGLGQVLRAAATALETIASNEVMVSKVIKTQDLVTDGSKVSAELRARATDLRAQADLADEDAAAPLAIVDYDQFNGVLEGELAELPWAWP